MRTTIRMNDELLRRLRARARESGTTITRLIEDAVRQALARPARGRRREHTHVHLPTFRGSGPAPGIDLDDTGALLDRMDEPGV